MLVRFECSFDYALGMSPSAVVRHKPNDARHECRTQRNPPPGRGDWCVDKGNNSPTARAFPAIGDALLQCGDGIIRSDSTRQERRSRDTRRETGAVDGVGRRANTQSSQTPGPPHLLRLERTPEEVSVPFQKLGSETRALGDAWLAEVSRFAGHGRL